MYSTKQVYICGFTSGKGKMSSHSSLGQKGQSCNHDYWQNSMKISCIGGPVHCNKQFEREKVINIFQHCKMPHMWAIVHNVNLVLASSTKVWKPNWWFSSGWCSGLFLRLMFLICVNAVISSKLFPSLSFHVLGVVDGAPQWNPVLGWRKGLPDLYLCLSSCNML